MSLSLDRALPAAGTRDAANKKQLDRLKRFISDQQGFPAERITLSSRFQADTGMAGDDGCDFLKRFEREFCVDMGPLRYDEHFAPEALPLAAGFAFSLILLFMAGTSLFWPWLIPAWAFALFFLLRREARRKQPGEIRVSDLLRSAEENRWTYDYRHLIVSAQPTSGKRHET